MSDELIGLTGGSAILIVSLVLFASFSLFVLCS